jgi:hypothetical protein
MEASAEAHHTAMDVNVEASAEAPHTAMDVNVSVVRVGNE